MATYKSYIYVVPTEYTEQLFADYIPYETYHAIKEVCLRSPKIKQPKHSQHIVRMWVNHPDRYEFIDHDSVMCWRKDNKEALWLMHDDHIMNGQYFPVEWESELYMILETN